MIDFLKTVSVFENLNIEELQTISKAVKPVDFENGELIFQAGDPATFFYIVTAGKVNLKLVVKIYNSSELLTIDELGSGELFGWSALVIPCKYTLSAYAEDKVKLLRLDSNKIKLWCKANPVLGYKLMQNFTSIISSRFSKLGQSLQNFIINTLAEKY